jgi:hypothetical protein
MRNSGSDQLHDRRDASDRPIHSPFFVPTSSTASVMTNLSGSTLHLWISLYDASRQSAMGPHE